MIPATSIHKIFVIGDPLREPERIQYFSSKGLDSSISYFQPTYKTNLREEEIQKHFPASMPKHGRPLKKAEMSICLNFLYLFEEIQSKFTGGHFLILESDVIFEQDLATYLQGLQPFLDSVKPDAVSVGSGCDLIDDNVNTDDMNFQIYPKQLVRCMDSYIFSYKGICKLLDYIRERGYLLDEPIDNFFETFLKVSKEIFAHYWVWPSLTLQGSQYGYYKTSIQEDVQEPCQ